MSNNLLIARREYAVESEIENFRQFLVVQKQLQPNSVRLCLGRLKIIQGDIQINKETIESYLFQRKQSGIKNNTLNSYIFALRMWGYYLESKGKSCDWIKSLRSFRKEPTEIATLTNEEIQKLIDCHIEYGWFGKLTGKEVTRRLNPLISACIVFLSQTACRFSEMAELKVSDVSLDNGTATFRYTKNHTSHRVPLSPTVIRNILPLLKDKNPEEFVFQSILGNKICPQTFADHLGRRAKKCGIIKRVHPHIFRHSFATEMLRNKADISTVGKLLNHKDIQTTYRYYDHVQADFLRAETLRHPLIREGATPEEIFNLVKEALMSFRLDKDPRFEVSQGEKRVEILLR